VLNDTYTIHDLQAAQVALHGTTVSTGCAPLPQEVRVAEAIARARDEAEKGALRLSPEVRASVQYELAKRVESLATDAKLAHLTRSPSSAAELEKHAMRVRHLITLFAALCLLAGCSLSHTRIEGPPLYVHLCDAMPAADQDAWGEAAGAINAELEGPALWVGHGAPVGCNTVDVCPSADVVGAETSVGTCVVTVRYAPGTAREATQELELLLGRLP
jgi:hypothetical protein